jgi:hypothetical protein
MDLRATTISLQFYKHARTAFQRPADRRSIRVEAGPDLAITRSCRAHETAYKLDSRKFASRILHSPARIGVEDGRNYALPPSSHQDFGLPRNMEGHAASPSSHKPSASFAR